MSKPLLRYLALTVLLIATPLARADELHVMTSGAFTAAYQALGPQFERATGHTLATAYGASMGDTPDAIPQRLARGEPADVVILAASAVDNLITQGRVVAGSRVDLVVSLIGIAVRAGQPKPDISSVDALRRTLLAAGSIAYSDSASGVYVSTELYQRLGIAEQVAPRSQRILSVPVGTVVARGDAELGFQQMSELIPIAGIEIVGPLPAEVQRATIFSAGLSTTSRRPDAARALIRFLNAPEAHAAIRASGLEPLPPRSGQTTN